MNWETNLLRIFKNGCLTLALGIFGTSFVSAQEEYCRTDRNNIGNGYHYEIWIQDGTPGSACLTVYEDEGRFKAEWDLDGYGFVARVGLFYGVQDTPAEEFGWFSSDYEFTKSGDGQAWMGIYGWTTEPLIEYYIIEDWNGWKPQFPVHRGTIVVDGAEYDVYNDVRDQKPSILGTRTFDQWFSVRKEGRQSGHISISEHFEKWKEMGYIEGGLYEAKLKVEGFGGTGTVDFTKATVQVGEKPDPIDTSNVDTTESIIPNSADKPIGYNQKSPFDGEISLLNLNGHVIQKKRIRKNETLAFATENIKAGLYLMRFKTEGRMDQYHKLIIK